MISGSCAPFRETLVGIERLGLCTARHDPGRPSKSVKRLGPHFHIGLIFLSPCVDPLLVLLETSQSLEETHEFVSEASHQHAVARVVTRSLDGIRSSSQQEQESNPDPACAAHRRRWNARSRSLESRQWHQHANNSQPLCPAIAAMTTRMWSFRCPTPASKPGY
jgi:hypothetical protein